MAPHNPASVFSNERKGPWLFFRFFSGIHLQLYRDYHKPWHKDPVINQPGFPMESRAGFFSWLSCQIIWRNLWSAQEVAQTFRWQEDQGVEYALVDGDAGGAGHLIPGWWVGSDVSLDGKVRRVYDNMLHVWNNYLHLPYPGDPITFWEWQWNLNTSKYYAFRRWLDIAIIIWEYDWIPRDK